jgi:hypothetical protein
LHISQGEVEAESEGTDVAACFLLQDICPAAADFDHELGFVMQFISMARKRDRFSVRDDAGAGLDEDDR